MPTTVTRADLAQAVIRASGLPSSDAHGLVELVFEEMSRALENGEEVKLSGFATFNLLDKKSRVGRNPKTGEEAEIKPRRVVSFTASRTLKAKVLEAHRSRPR